MHCCVDSVRPGEHTVCCSHGNLFPSVSPPAWGSNCVAALVPATMLENLFNILYPCVCVHSTILPDLPLLEDRTAMASRGLHDG